jgi:hypothetical protein
MNVDVWNSFFVENDTDQPCRTRCGYAPNEALRSLQKTLGESGSASTARAIHLAADIVCSGGLEALFRLVWEYALTHIGLASPRIFVYLSQRIKEVDGMLKTLPDEMAYSNETFQIRIGEMIIVLRDAPTQTILSWPKVAQETHAETWIRAVAVDPVTETAVLRRVWQSGADNNILRIAGGNLCKAVIDGSTEKSLFWVKWLLDHEALVNRVHHGASLSTLERGPATLAARQRKHVSYFILQLFGEMYKEFAAKQMIRMNEETSTLVSLWTTPPKGLGATARRQILTILTQILTEVPKWKIPAAPALIKDPLYLTNAVKAVPKFFQEVLAYDPPKKAAEIQKALKSKAPPKPKVKPVTTTGAMTQMEAYEKAMEAYLTGSGKK